MKRKYPPQNKMAVIKRSGRRRDRRGGRDTKEEKRKVRASAKDEEDEN